MKILLFGKNGQVGWALQRSLAPFGELIALDRHSENHCGVLDDLNGIVRSIQRIQPDIIVNAAAYTTVDKAESEPEQARFLNVLAPGAIAYEAHRLGAWFVNYFTDHVFDGSGNQQWTEADTPAPLNIYGKTKLEGEPLIAQHCSKHLIFRTSWVYAARGSNFARTMLRLVQECKRLSLIDDQYGAPTGADLIADVTAHAIRQVMQRPQDGCLYHLAAAGKTTWHEFARHVLPRAETKLLVQEVVPIPSSAFPTAARRPHSYGQTANLLRPRTALMAAWCGPHDG